MKRYMDPEMEVVSFEIEDVTNFGGGEGGEISEGEIFGSFNSTVDW
ncbi:MAG: hypothetical protein IKH31_01595 [Clostridia bacterium]|nr:hypothetical protein [Clostridia bacterium]MBR3486255.1 hypothetical protein [Clostridia bacterium]